MARVKLIMPATQIGEVQIPVRITDLNYGNHVGNDAIVGILHEARACWLQTKDMTELDAGGTSLIMADLMVEYKKQIFYPDTLTTTIYCAEVSNFSFELFYAMHNAKKELVVQAKTGMVSFDYKKQKVAAISLKLKAALQ